MVTLNLSEIRIESKNCTSKCNSGNDQETHAKVDANGQKCFRSPEKLLVAQSSDKSTKTQDHKTDSYDNGLVTDSSVNERDRRASCEEA